MFDPEKFLIKLRCVFVPSRRRRNEIRLRAVEALNKKRQGRAVWGMSYSVFDGEELLEGSLKSVRGEVDYINVIYQSVSWYGKPADPALLPLLLELKEKKLIDELAEFKPDLDRPPSANEIAKRNFGLQLARRFGCTYFMTMDCDEFYLAGEIKQAKEDIIRWNLSHSYCPQILYGFEPTSRIVNSGGSGFVPFFAKLRPWSKLASRTDLPCKADKTRCLARGFFAYEKVLDRICMHHMNMVRKDLRAKVDNSSFADGRLKISVPKSEELATCRVDNQFGIDMKALK